ncbi:tumor necrosis factor receptor superfamily member 14-like [Talpa occidentalis]|uniref:tumor necrosis factor receptor superfamily member 14-like n=1 Tax=Talpa occidentalis TaxID=50954 RepID=UPI00188F84C8|nr:tumor necrosis factor receptor superfamily member 14-like [Talpa occidentalis]
MSAAEEEQTHNGAQAAAGGSSDAEDPPRETSGPGGPDPGAPQAAGPLCAPAPTYLGKVPMLILLGSPPCAPAVGPCKDEEYLVGAECCPKCSPGYRVKQPCGEYTGTVCVPCAPGTYTDKLNDLRECLPCRDCRPALGLVTRRGCSPTGDTVCGCVPGHVCVPEHGDSCAQCQPHTACRPGQSVRQRGTEWQDTLCEDCPPGTFSPDGTLEQCRPHVACRPGQSVRQRGTEQQDTLCEDCPPGTFSPNGTLEQCRPHTACRPGQSVRQRGTEQQDTLCEDCPPGTFSPDGTLEQCRPHSACRPGQSVRQRGTERQDTLCGDCPHGTFSPNGTLVQCRPWTRCSRLQVEANPGTSSSDVTCSSWPLILLVLLLLLLLVPVLGALGVLGARWALRGRNGRPGEPPTGRPHQMRTQGAAGDPAAAQALQACPAVATEAEEETVP